MLPSITNELRTELGSRGVPYPVVYGPERLQQSSTVQSHVVVERDRERGDTVEAPPAHRRNPRMLFRRGIGAVVTVYARSNAAGARVGDHERVADKVVDQLLVSFREVLGARKVRGAWTQSKLLSAGELAERGLESWAGVVYELRLQIGRGVTGANFQDEAADEAEMGGTPGIGTVSTTVDTSDSPAITIDLPTATTRTDQ